MLDTPFAHARDVIGLTPNLDDAVPPVRSPEEIADGARHFPIPRRCAEEQSKRQHALLQCSLPLLKGL